ncbi:MAG TPA: MFS transporter, partial [Solibacterales bacterium]|nr:MFS transporter [Bryobacterales bacterium]
GAVMVFMVYVIMLLEVRNRALTHFSRLLLPGAAVGALLLLLLARREFPAPPGLPIRVQSLDGQGLPRRFWLYLAGASLMAAGFLDFPIVAWRLSQSQLFEPAWIPALYALAMGVDAAAALLFGRLFDRHGFRVLAAGAGLAAAGAPLVLLGGRTGVVAGVILWGAALGAQESIVKAAVAAMVPAERRASAFGIFHAVFGGAWFAGSLAAGWLLSQSAATAAALAALLSLLAIPVLLRSGDSRGE